MVIFTYYMYYLKNEQGCIITEFLNLIIHDCEFYERLQHLRYRSLILALRFRFGVFSSKILDVTFCRVFIKYTHKSKNFLCFFFMNC